MRLFPSALILLLTPLSLTAQSVAVANGTEENRSWFAQEMTDVAYQNSVPGIQQMLVATARSAEDSERIARNFAQTDESVEEPQLSI